MGQPRHHFHFVRIRRFSGAPDTLFRHRLDPRTCKSHNVFWPSDCRCEPTVEIHPEASTGFEIIYDVQHQGISLVEGKVEPCTESRNRTV